MQFVVRGFFFFWLSELPILVAECFSPALRHPTQLGPGPAYTPKPYPAAPCEFFEWRRFGHFET